jgi:hypothetical protein
MIKFGKKPSTFHNMETCHTLTKYSIFFLNGFHPWLSTSRIQKKLEKTYNLWNWCFLVFEHEAFVFGWAILINHEAFVFGWAILINHEASILEHGQFWMGKETR